MSRAFAPRQYGNSCAVLGKLIALPCEVSSCRRTARAAAARSQRDCGCGGAATPSVSGNFLRLELGLLVMADSLVLDNGERFILEVKTRARIAQRACKKGFVRAVYSVAEWGIPAFDVAHEENRAARRAQPRNAVIAPISKRITSQSAKYDPPNVTSTASR